MVYYRGTKKYSWVIDGIYLQWLRLKLEFQDTLSHSGNETYDISETVSQYLFIDVLDVIISFKAGHMCKNLCFIGNPLLKSLKIEIKKKLSSFS